MKSPFLVAAQMKANSLEKIEREMMMTMDGPSEEGWSASASSSSSLSSSTSSLNGGYSSATPSSNTPSSSSKKSSKKQQKQKVQAQAQAQQQQQQGKKSPSLNGHAKPSMPDLNALPGTPVQVNSNQSRSSPTRSSTEEEEDSRISRASDSSTVTKTRSRANTRAIREAERNRKAKRRSNAILVTSALPIVAVLAYDYFNPAHVRLSTEDTRQASWHLTTLASKCLYLSYQIPSSDSSALSNLFHLTNSNDLRVPLNESKISNILLRGFSSTSSTTTEETTRYLKGFDDIYVVLIWISIWTFFREVIIRFICSPIGKYVGGINKTGSLLRFGEQGYDVISHLLAFTFGFFIMQNKESGYKNMNLENGLWKDYPHFKLLSNLKFYYLCQMGFWLQQVLTLHLEKRRKDYSQMFLHHIITVSLLYLSYIYNFTRIGNVILILMDVSDIILGIAKMLKYLKFNKLCDFTFVLFMMSWIITRHYYYFKVLNSVIYSTNKYLIFDWNPSKEWYYSKNTKKFFIILLSALQILLILWFFMILKVALGVLKGKPAEDSRSDDEGESEETVTDGSMSSSSISSSYRKRGQLTSNSDGRVVNGSTTPTLRKRR